MTDAELVDMARRGDRDACDRLIERHQVAVYRAAYAALRDAGDAEEVAQDTFVRAFRALTQYRGDSSFRTWLLRIAWRRALTRRRRAALQWKREPVEDLAAFADTGAGPERQAAAAELHRHVRRLIAALPRNLRDALLLAQAGEYTYDEIAAMLAVPTGTVKWRVSDARRRLREELAALGYEQRR